MSNPEEDIPKRNLILIKSDAENEYRSKEESTKKLLDSQLTYSKQI